MPLQTGASDDVIQRNIAQLIAEGYDPPQAAAIAYSHAGKDASGGSVFLSIPLAGRDELVSLQNALALAMGSQFEPHPKDRFHITLTYCETLPASDAISQMEGFSAPPFKVRVSGVGMFNSPGSRAVFATVDHNTQMDNLQSDCYKRLERFSPSVYSVPERWQPHITLGYLPPGIDLPCIAVTPFVMDVGELQITADDYELIEVVALKKSTKSASQKLIEDIKQRLSEAEAELWIKTYADAFEETQRHEAALTAAWGAVRKLQMVARVKSAADGGALVEGWGMLFTDADNPDLDDEYFSDLTGLMTEYYNDAPLWYEHGMDDVYGTSPIGQRVSLKVYRRGIWVTHRLHSEHPHYERTLKELRAGKLSYSSDSMSQYVSARPDGGILSWPLAGWSLTASPAEPALGSVLLVDVGQFEKTLKSAIKERESEPNKHDGSERAGTPDTIRDSDSQRSREAAAKIASALQLYRNERIAYALKSAINGGRAQ